MKEALECIEEARKEDKQDARKKNKQWKRLRRFVKKHSQDSDMDGNGKLNAMELQDAYHKFFAWHAEKYPNKQPLE